MSRALALAATLTLAALLVGCASPPPPEPIIKTVTVNVPVAVHCNPEIGADPQYPDTPKAIQNAQSIFERVRILLAARIMRMQRERELVAALEGCK